MHITELDGDGRHSAKRSIERLDEVENSCSTINEDLQVEISRDVIPIEGNRFAILTKQPHQFSDSCLEENRVDRFYVDLFGEHSMYARNRPAPNVVTRGA